MLIHRIWLGSEMPSKFEEYGREWLRLNPDHEVWDWDEDDIAGHWAGFKNISVLQDLHKKSQAQGADYIAYVTQVADVVDYEIMYKYGGWYFNTDMKPLKSLNTLDFDRTQPALAMEDDIHPVNMAMYSPPGHPFFKKVLEILPQRYFSMPGEYMNATTGVQLLQQAIREYGPVQTFPRNVFNPIHWSEFGYGEEPNTEREYSAETVAVHEWLHRTNQRGQRVLET
jgi:mannosyltransferase OCH1-like enzyme